LIPLIEFFSSATKPFLQLYSTFVFKNLRPCAFGDIIPAISGKMSTEYIVSQ
jgi:hypothetical protein